MMGYRDTARSTRVVEDTPQDNIINTESIEGQDTPTTPNRVIARVSMDKKISATRFKKAVANASSFNFESIEETYARQPYKFKTLMIDNYHTNQANMERTSVWNKTMFRVSRNIQSLIKMAGTTKELVKNYQYNSESLDMELTKNLISGYNKRMKTNFTLNAEDIVGYSEVMNEILNHTADNIDTTRGNLATLMGKVESEINGIKVDKYKEILIKIQNDIQNKSARIVAVADTLLKTVGVIEDKSEEGLQEAIKKMEYGLGALHKDDVTVANSIGVEQGLTNDQIVNLAQAVRTYLDILSSNKIAIDCLNTTADDDTTWQNNISNTLSAFVTKVLPGLNTTYKTLLKVLHSEDPMTKTLQPNEISDKLRSDINKYIAAFAKVVGVENDDKLYIYHQSGYYALKEDENIVKVVIPDDAQLPVLTNEKLTFLTNVLQTTNITSSVLTQFPNTMSVLLKSNELEANETNQLYNITLVLGVIATLANLYRDEVIYGIYGLHKALSEIGNAYYNVVTCIEKISNGQLKTKDN